MDSGLVVGMFFYLSFSPVLRHEIVRKNASIDCRRGESEYGETNVKSLNDVLAKYHAIFSHISNKKSKFAAIFV